MEEEKYKLSFSPKLFSSETRRGKLILKVNFQRLIPWLSLVMLALVYANIGLACSTNFMCSNYLPSLLYLGNFRGHDRLFIVACTYYSLVLALLYLGTHLSFSGVLPRFVRLFSGALGGISCISLPLLALADEVNGVYPFPIVSVRDFLCLVFLWANFLWLLIAYFSLYKMAEAYNSQEAKWFGFFKVLFTLCVCFGIFLYSQGSLDESLDTNSRSFVEWGLLTAGVAFPAVIAQLCRGYVLSFSVNIGPINNSRR